jgi:hypothetical protein
MNKIIFILITTLLICALSAMSFATNITSTGNGNWSANAWPNTARTGTITTLTSSATVTGTGTLFLTEISVGNIIKTSSSVAIGTVASITDNTHLTFAANAASTNNSITYRSQGVGSVDNVTISSGFVVIMDVTHAYCNTLTVDGQQNSYCSLTLSGTNILTVTGAVTMNRPDSLNVNAGTLNAASLNMTGGTLANIAILKITTGTVTITGNISFLGGVTAIQKIIMGSGTLNIGGNFGANGTFTAGTGTVNFDGTGNQTIGPYTYNNLTINNTSGSNVGIIAPGITVNGELLLESGVVDNSINPITLGPGGHIETEGGNLIIPMPVELTSFTAKLQGTNALLNWATATETNNSGFQIERSIEGLGVWGEVAFVHGAGTSNSPKIYSYEDRNLIPGKYIYRIKQIDNDGKYEYYTATMPKVDVGVANTLQLCDNYPNPFNPTTMIQFSIPQDGYATMKIYNMLGQEVATLFSGMAKSGHYIQTTFDASRFASGIYFARLQYGGKSLMHRMLMTK